MNEESTVANLFDLAVLSERAAQQFYLGLADLFAHQAEVASFWKAYARQESNHARWLEKLRALSTPEVLNGPADPHMLTAIRHMFRYTPERILAQIDTLEHAYQQAVEFENSETNTVFDFLITHYHREPETAAFLRAQLSDHIALLDAAFPATFRNAVSRSALRARRQAGDPS